jgi:hypothetical protein
MEISFRDKQVPKIFRVSITFKNLIWPGEKVNFYFDFCEAIISRVTILI